MRMVRAGGLLMLAGLALGVGRAGAQSCTVDLGTDEQTIDGFGFCTTWSPVMTSDQAQVLFGTADGQLGFTLLRVYIDETGDFSSDAANAVIAHAYGATVLGTAWTPPPAMKTSNSSVGGSLLPSQYAAYAAYLAGAAQAIGLDLVSFQNEPDILVTYQSCTWTPQQMETFMDNNAAAVGRPIVMPESYHFDDSYSDPTLDDSAGVNQIAYVAGHLYGGGNIVHANALNHGKHVWMTEHYNTGQDLPSAMIDAKEVSDCMNNQFSAYIWWHAYHAALTDLDLLNGSAPLMNGYAIGQFSRWIRPGYVRCATTYNPQGSVYVTAYHHNLGLVIVALNTGNAPVTQTFALENGTATSLIPYQTGGPYGRQMNRLDPVSVSAGSFTFTLDPNTVTTFVQIDSAVPVILAQPTGQIVYPDSGFSLSVAAAGSGLAYQWYKDGVPLAGQTQSTYLDPGASASDSGNYTVTVSNAGGTVTSQAAAVSVTTEAARLVNLSSNIQLAAGQSVTAGFVIAGNGDKSLLIRAAGPALDAFGVGNPMPDPQLTLYQGSTVVARNSQWNPAQIGDAFAQVGAFAFPSGSKDAAMLVTLPVGQYTVAAQSASGGAGTVLLEVYDADPAGTQSRLTNLSANGALGGQTTALTVGFVLGGEGTRDLLIRGAGPALAAFAVTEPLPDPQLTLYAAGPTQIGANFGWGTAEFVGALSWTTGIVGAFAFADGSADCALLTTLSPGSYSAQITSASGAAGDALAEIYAAP